MVNPKTKKPSGSKTRPVSQAFRWQKPYQCARIFVSWFCWGAWGPEASPFESYDRRTKGQGRLSDSEKEISGPRNQK